jgi:cytochrome c oxidase subunit 2
MWTNFPLFPDNASTIAAGVDFLYYSLVAISVFFSVLIFALIFYFAIKYRRKAPNEIPRPIHGSLRLELFWSITPGLIALTLFGWGTALYFNNADPPRDAMDIYVVGKQWMWKLQHPEGQREINELHVPVGKAVRLTMATEDVIHSFYVPAFRVKKDVVPGRYSTLWFQPTKTGKYHLFCAEYCGNQHSGMIGWVHVMEQVDYENWLSGAVTGETMAEAGEKLFHRLGCYTCHRSDAPGRGPVLEGLYGSTVLLQTGQKIIADDAYIRESILSPSAKVVAGFRTRMPTFQGQVTEEQLLQLIAYIKSLGPKERINTEQ